MNEVEPMFQIPLLKNKFQITFDIKSMSDSLGQNVISISIDLLKKIAVLKIEQPLIDNNNTYRQIEKLLKNNENTRIHVNHATGSDVIYTILSLEVTAKSHVFELNYANSEPATHVIEFNIDGFEIVTK